MPRVARIVIPGCPHHLTQRGNNRQAVFFVNDDFRVYLELLAQRSAAAGVEVLGYCLMPNHVHLILVPRTETALAQAVGRTHWLYTQYVNRLHGRSGHLWQNRFFSCPLDEPYLWTALRYVERNPVRARLSRSAETYPWSSAAAHVARTSPPAWLDLEDWSAAWTAAHWRAALREPLEDGEVARVRRHVHTGRPLGTDSFLSKLEARLGRRLRARDVGRPRKPVKKRSRVKTATEMLISQGGK